MSPRRVENIECPRCHRIITDTGAESITCHYCGYTIDRSKISHGAEEGGREKLITELTHSVRIYKWIRNISFIVGGISLIAPLIILFFINYTAYLQIGATLVPAVLWLIIGMNYSTKVEKTRSKLFDIVGERKLIE